MECLQYRKFGRHDVQVSALGFGMMRLPILDGDTSRIDEAKTQEMIEYAIGQGVNYFDTAYPYHREQSEVITGKVLKNGYRDRVYLATKCPSWLIQTHDDYDKYLDIQFRRLQTDCIDMYLMHSLDKDRWDGLVKTDVFGFMDKAKADGRIRFAGFSFHDDIDTFKKIVDAYDWDFCQIQYNYMDEQFQAGTEGLKYAHAKDMAVIVMEPLRGGTLARSGLPQVQAVWDKENPSRKPAEWGLRWVWNHPEVSLLLSGMGEMYQVVENVNTAKDAYPNALSPKELDIYERVKAVYRSRVKVDCTACDYCQPCPQGIRIPNWFQSYNTASMFDTLATFGQSYERLKGELGNPAICAECGQCEAVCPQSLQIIDHLKEIVRALREN